MKMSRIALSLAALAVLTALLLAACGGGDAGLSRAEVEEIVRSEMADAPAPEPGLNVADVEEAIRRALAEMPQPEAGNHRRRGGADSARRGGLHSAQVRTRRVLQVLRREGHQQV